jgi:hypothetical protein
MYAAAVQYEVEMGSPRAGPVGCDCQTVENRALLAPVWLLLGLGNATAGMQEKVKTRDARE